MLRKRNKEKRIKKERKKEREREIKGSVGKYISTQNVQILKEASSDPIYTHDGAFLGSRVNDDEPTEN